MEKIKWSYSFNEESYTGEFDSKEEAIEEAIQYIDDEKIIYVGKNKELDISSYFNIDRMLEDIEESLYSEELSFAENNIIEVEDKAELDKEIKKLIKEYCSTRYYAVYDVENIEVNEAMLNEVEE